MALNQDDVIKILKIMNESCFDELNLKMGELQLNVKRNCCDSISNSHESMLENHACSIPVNHFKKKTEESSQNATIAKQAEDSCMIQQSLEDEIAGQGLTSIKSPMLGIFYEAPKPGSPPFVEVGTLVEENTTVCTIEVMKLFSTIKAGIKGRIKQTCVVNGEMVQYGQIIFVVDPNVE
jgi:acetyl-CoA carboxylase biotin carboxyl carrier protein